MRFQTIGNPEKPKALLVHAMYVNGGSFSALVEYLKDNYFLIIPTLDGHDVNEDSTFLSSYDEADKILAFLQENKIGELDFILGTSLGAIIAFEVFKQNRVKINKVFLDGGPFFKFGPWLQRFAFKKFWSICRKARQNPENVMKKFDSLFPGLGNTMCEVCSHMTEETVLNLAHACYSYNLPDLGYEAQKVITFIYGTKEPAYMCRSRLKKYKHSLMLKKDDYKHCEYLLTNPKEYAEVLNGE